MNIHRTKKAMVALCAVVGLGGCGDLDVPDLDNPSLDDFRNSPTPSGVYSASTGLLLGHRVGVAARNGYVAELGVIGREAYVFDGAEPRTVQELLGPQLDPGALAFGGNFWSSPYANIRNANTLLAALDIVPGVDDADKEAIRGFAKTMQALDFLVVINTRDTNGVPIDVDRPLGSELAPIESKEAVFAHISRLLDEGANHLRAGGSTFPFSLSTGFMGPDERSRDDDFDNPRTTFLRFNRAIRARVAVYQADYQGALTALSESFIDATAPLGDGEGPDDDAAHTTALTSLSRGVYHTFSTGSGELENLLSSGGVFAHPSIETDADRRANGSLDARVTRKTQKMEEAVSAADGKLTTDLEFTLYPKGDSQVPIIRNEELILLRAEANIGLGNIGAAADDINYIRTRSGRLAARTDITAENALDELLKQKRYSLLFEGGHRWIDLRRYNRLDTLPRELDPSFAPHERFPIPAVETDGRK
ncbi:RagB/SusD family nutrient uptake outer membrane protein [Myxococcus sp. RHSTA-1-4]|uniref:RagB/SusD family nutrient uptake outer membrane protein n=1 Tax=Myxococcus sp. RHSTA-1-4 TaxID=2874601 RepID=UPI001CC15139|nr:RagB/SusD family nutrient uptake outer membrane protein [Myxococcus sp. RHSTA-1-4]MBZ4420022.1 RagB/SusD family nutrient uptake outer membrane protein [Myxococcus sp. RHSTA-1-4]